MVWLAAIGKQNLCTKITGEPCITDTGPVPLTQVEPRLLQLHLASGDRAAKTH